MAELARVDLGDGQGFATLAEALARFPDTRFNIDVKTDAAVDADRRRRSSARAPRAPRAAHLVLRSAPSAGSRRALPGVATSAASAASVRSRLAAAALRSRVARSAAPLARCSARCRFPSGSAASGVLSPALVAAAHARRRRGARLDRERPRRHGTAARPRRRRPRHRPRRPRAARSSRHEPENSPTKAQPAERERPA